MCIHITSIQYIYFSTITLLYVQFTYKQLLFYLINLFLVCIFNVHMYNCTFV